MTPSGRRRQEDTEKMLISLWPAALFSVPS